MRTAFFPLIICLALFAGCLRDECYCDDSSSYVPVQFMLQQGHAYYWLRLDSAGAPIDSAVMQYADTRYSEGATILISLSKIFPSVSHYEDYNYLLVSRSLGVADTFSNFKLKHGVYTADTDCRHPLICPETRVQEYTLNGEHFAISEYDDFFHPIFYPD